MVKTWITVLIGVGAFLLGGMGGLFWGGLGGGVVGGIAGASAGAAIGSCSFAEIARQKGYLNDAQVTELLNEFKDTAVKKIRTVPGVQIPNDAMLKLDNLDCSSVIRELQKP